MPKPGLPHPGPTGLADWLPLLGSICQVLATLGQEEQRKTAEPDALTVPSRSEAEAL